MAQHTVEVHHFIILVVTSGALQGHLGNMISCALQGHLENMITKQSRGD